MKGQKAQDIKELELLLGIADRRARSEADPEMRTFYNDFANECGNQIKRIEKGQYSME